MATAWPTPERAEESDVARPHARQAPELFGRAVSRRQIGRYELIGLIVVTWISAYLGLRPWESVSAALARATLITWIWVAIRQHIARSFGSKTFVIGPFVISACTAVLGVATMAALQYAIPELGVRRVALLLAASVIFVATGGWAYAARRLARAPTRVLVAGGGAPTARLLADLRRERDARYELVAFVDDGRSQALERHIPCAGSLGELSEAVRALSPDLVVVAVPRGRPQVFAQLLMVADAGFQVVGLPEIYEFAFGRLPVEDLTSAWFMSVLHAYNRNASRLLKRGFDIVVALVGLVVTLPLIPVVFVIVKRTPGALLYRQERLGEHGRLFTILKFRSMRSDAEAMGGARWAIENDPRVIPGGRMLRTSRLDEIPQLWNVLRGEMSIVGPRPERPEFIEQLHAQVPFWTQRHLLKPGITGWAQIRAGYAADALGTVEKLSYDLWYLRHRSLLLDVVICMRTIPRMLARRGGR